MPGLSSAEAAARFAVDGPNELPQERARSGFAIALEVVRQPMFLMLVAAGALYLAIGDPADAAMLLGFVFVVMGITIVQERRTERALQALKDLSSPRAIVIRDGIRQHLPARDLVRGDLIVISEGDRVPADAALQDLGSVTADESLLTGESVPVLKQDAVFSGTLVVGGQAIAEVTATGARTELGKIGKALQTLEREPTPLQSESGRLVRMMAIVGLALSGVVVVAYALTRGGALDAWRDGALAGIALAMAVLPEEFPVILTIFLAFGAWRISRRHVLTRRMPAVETLGAATVLCVDKTGTLTFNQMRIDAVEPAGRRAEILDAAVRACRPEPFDPMERAIFEAIGRKPSGELVREYPLTPRLLAVSQAWKVDGGPLLVASKGAPEAIARLCGIDAPDVARLASKGLRVLGVASARVAALPEKQEDLKLSFLGLVALHDPVRPAVPAAVQECRDAGIRVVMITGDYPATASAIAADAGLARPDGVLTGPQLEKLSGDELTARVRGNDVFARVVPEQKLRIVQALKKSGEIVGMTGDGVNDAPALKAAHIGVAMGKRGTDVAREAAALVLLDDEFPSIVAAVRLGRRIFDNIKKAFTYTFAVHVPIAGLSLAPLVWPHWPLLLMPVHIVFMELIIDPACSLVFEAEEAEPDVMHRPPRDPRERLFSKSAVGFGLLQGAGVLAFAIIAYAMTESRAIVFTAIVIGNLFLILGNRSQTRGMIAMLGEPNSALWWVVGGTVVFLTLALSIPALREVFHFAGPSPRELWIGIAAGVATAPWLRIISLLRGARRAAPRSPAARSTPRG